jgi:hypothetical protein
MAIISPESCPFSAVIVLGPYAPKEKRRRIVVSQGRIPGVSMKNPYTNDDGARCCVVSSWLARMDAMSISLDTTVSSLMTNRRRVGALKSLGVLTVHDAITYYPFRVTDPVPLLPLRSITVGTAAAFAGVVRGTQSQAAGRAPRIQT